MSGLLPTAPDATIERSEEPQLLCLDDDRTMEIMTSLSSERSQTIFRRINEEPMSATDLAEELDTSVQAVTYHLDSLQETGLIDVLDTCYSVKGREMDVYGPRKEPYLVFLAPEDDGPGLKAAFKRFAGAVGPIGVVLALGSTLSRLLGQQE